MLQGLGFRAWVYRDNDIAKVGEVLAFEERCPARKPLPAALIAGKTSKIREQESKKISKSGNQRRSCHRDVIHGGIILAILKQVVVFMKRRSVLPTREPRPVSGCDYLNP